MDQSVSNTDLARLAMTAMGMSLAGNTAKAAGAVEGQFQKLLEQRVKPAEKPAQTQNAGEKDKAQAGPAEKPVQQAEAGQKPQKVGETARKAEDPLEQVKKLAEQGAVFAVPSQDMCWIDCDLETGEIFGVYGPDEYIIAYLDGEGTNIPIVDLSPGQMEELQEIVGEFQQVIDASDPEADALLEATDPTVDHSLGKVLEKAVDEQAGEIIREAAEQIEAPEEDVEVEVTDHEAEAEPVFHDVKAAPIKVGETFDARQAQDVNEQIAAQLIPAMEQGQTKVELQLTPEHLGTVKVEITQSENGALHIAITAESSQTRSLLEKHADGLQGLLAARSQNTVQVEVQRQEESQPKNPYDGHNGQNQQQQQQEQHRPRHSQNSQDFMHQLRLGLVAETPDEA